MHYLISCFKADDVGVLWVGRVRLFRRRKKGDLI